MQELLQLTYEEAEGLWYELPNGTELGGGSVWIWIQIYRIPKHVGILLAPTSG
jgi:hypothetical protein